MGRSGTLTKTDKAQKTEDCEILKLGIVSQVLRDHIIINLFNAQVINLPSECALESLCEREVVQIIEPTPASLFESQMVTKLNRPIFGTIEEISDEAVKISVEGVSHKRRILVLPRGFMEGFYQGPTILDKKIKIFRGARKGGMNIIYV